MRINWGLFDHISVYQTKERGKINVNELKQKQNTSYIDSTYKAMTIPIIK